MEGKFTMSGSSFYGKSPFKKNGKFNFKKNSLEEFKDDEENRATRKSKGTIWEQKNRKIKRQNPGKNKSFNFKNKGNFNFTKTNKYIDPDAPGTPGTPGYEPPVKRSDLDDKGKKIWDKKNK